MKLLSALFFAGAMALSASTYSQKTKIDLQIKDSSVSEILSSIEKNSEFIFIYNANVLNTEVRKSISVKGENIERVLELLFKEADVNYRIDDRQIFLYKKEDLRKLEKLDEQLKLELPVEQPQKKELKGKITDAKGAAIPGTTVLVKGTQVGTISDFNGTFSLDVPLDAKTLVFSFVGMTSQEVEIGNTTFFSITLEEQTVGLEEVVAVGYGTVRKSDLTGSVSSLKVEESQTKDATSFEQMLQGRVSGVQITQNTGDVGSGISFSVRGATSLTGSNQPLIIVDGYPINSDNSNVKIGSQDFMDTPSENALAGLNPKDILSVEILKDASAAAIYGSRAANGVVLITTKQGSVGKTLIDYSYDTNLGLVRKKLDVLNAAEYIDYRNSAFLSAGRDSVYRTDNIPGLLENDFNWQDLVFRTSVTRNHNLNLSGGDSKTKFAISLGYLDQEGVVQNSNYERGSLRANLVRNLTSKLVIGLNSYTVMSTKNAVQQSTGRDMASGSVVRGALRSPPVNTPYTPEGEINEDIEGNPLTMITKAVDKNDITSLTNNMYAEYTIIDGLMLKFRAGMDQTMAERNFYHPRGTWLGSSRNGFAYKGYRKSINYLTETTLSYNKIINKKHRINTVGGYTWQEWHNNDFGLNVQGFPNDNELYYNLRSASSNDKPRTNYEEYALSSILGRMVYSYDGRYMFTFTGRADGSTRLAENYKWAFFPSVALGWNVAEEKFMKNIEVVNQFKIRGSYGISGNQSISVGATKALLSSTTAVVNQSIQTGYGVSGMANDQLGWENTKQTNLGFDMGLFKSRLTFTFDYYKKLTEGLLIALRLPPSTGVFVYNTNNGTVENKGYEFDLGVTPLIGKFKWDVSANLSINRNKVIELGGTGSFFGSSFGAIGGQVLNIATVGKPMGSFYGYRIDGIYQNQVEIDEGPKDSSTPSPGSFKFKDISGPDGVPDGIIDASDREIIGNPFPDFTFGITNNFSWKQLSLTVLVQGSIGQDVVNGNRYGMDALSAGSNSNVNYEAYSNRWTGEGTSNYYPKASTTNDAFNARFTDFIVEDATFVRVKSTNLSYDVNVNKIKFLRSLSIYVAGTNLLTWTNYKGFDPEINSKAGNNLQYGLDFGSIPQFRTFSFGVNIGIQ